MRAARLAATSVGLAALAACDAGDRAAPAFDFDRQVGWIHGACLAIADEGLAAGDVVKVVVLGERQTLADATVTGTASPGSDCPALLGDRRAVNEDGTNAFYHVAVVATADTTPGELLGIGILQPAGPLSAADGRVSGDIDGDGQSETFAHCNSSEGLHFRVWSGGDGTGEPAWDGYYYLGYDLEPTCP